MDLFRQLSLPHLEDHQHMITKCASTCNNKTLGVSYNLQKTWSWSRISQNLGKEHAQSTTQEQGKPREKS